MAKKKKRGLGDTAVQLRERTAKIGHQIDAGACHAAFDAIRATDVALAEQNRDPFTYSNYGAVLLHFQNKCMIKNSVRRRR